MIAIVAATLLGSFAVGQPPPSIELRWSAGVAPASLQRRRLGARSLSYSYMCEAGGPCATPEALAHDYFDGNVTLIATYYQVSSNATSGEATEHEVNSKRRKCHDEDGMLLLRCATSRGELQRSL